jgi:hypothetical protein
LNIEKFMTDIIRFNQVEDKIFVLRDQNVIFDSDVAALYGVQTKEINQAVRNNPDKFPSGYILEVDNKEFARLRSKILTANVSAKSRVLPKAFNEKGLYMLATILKGKKATQTTIELNLAMLKVKHTVKRKK